MKAKRVKKLVLIILSLLVTSSCDFSPPYQREILLAQEYIQNHDYVKAISLYEKILKRNPTNDLSLKIYFQLGDLYSIYLAKYPIAIDYYKKVKEITDDPLWTIKVEEKIADINFTYLRNFEKSYSSYTLLSKFIPKLQNHDFYKYRSALSLQNSNKFEESLLVLNSIKDDSASTYNIKSYYSIGITYFHMQNWKDAISFWREYLRLETNKESIVQTKFIMANAYEMLENLKTAYNIYYSILGEYPNTEVIQNRINSIYARRVARKR